MWLQSPVIGPRMGWVQLFNLSIAQNTGCVFIQFLAKLAATRMKFSTIGRESSFNQAISILLEIFVSRIGRQTTSGGEIDRTQAGATDTPSPAPTSRRMDNQ